MNQGDVMKLPVSLYPPDLASVDSVREKIIDAAAKQADTYLVKGKVESNVGETITYHLTCQKARAIVTKKATGKENNDGLLQYNDGLLQYQDGVKNDRIVDKAKSSRGPQGRSQPHRTQSTRIG